MRAILPNILILIFAYMTSSCTEIRPSDELIEKTLMTYAKNEEMDGIIIDDFEKENAWEDTAGNNIYYARYKYTLRLTKPLSELILSNSKELTALLINKEEKPGFLGLNDSLTAVSLVMQSSSWLSAQGQAGYEKLNEVIKDCLGCADFLYKGTEEQRKIRGSAFIYALVYFENIGFKNNAKIGDKASRQVYSGFMKTENGWVPIASQ